MVAAAKIQLTNQWQDPAFRVGQLSAAKARWSDPAYRTERRAASKLQMADPSVREAIAERHRRNGHSVPPDARYMGGPTEMESLLLSALPGSVLHHRVPRLMSAIDLAMPAARVAIEVDGASHRKVVQKARDRRKEEFLMSRGWRVIRVSNESVLNDLEATATFITVVASRPAAAQEARPW